ncbi:MAG: GNAT family N-acetyltransferase [Planctomycetota bacterium]|nr:GNAT family N-acetyltransferase [Planctomycetota bacterium]
MASHSENPADMFTPAHYGPAREDDLARLGLLVHEAFSGAQEGAEAWMRSHGVANVRVVRESADGQPVACLSRIVMGQFFGGRSVPMVGIAGVATDVTRRGGGLGKRLMGACVRELAAEGVALSALYASTRAFYRRVGYESAGGRYEYEIPIPKIPTCRAELEVRRLTDDDQPAMTRCYEAVARSQNGMLDRGPYCWGRVWKFRENPYRVFGAVGPTGDLEGYVAVFQRSNPEFGRHGVQLSDAIFTTPAAARTLVGLLANYATMGDALKFFGGPTHPIHLMLGHHWGSVRLHEPWMLRITSVPAALEARGYDPFVRGRLVIDVHDELVEANRGVWEIEVEGGRARVRRGSGEAMCVTVRGLAAMYSGYLVPEAAATCGLCAGTAAQFAIARAMFGGPTPWMPDFF